MWEDVESSERFSALPEIQKSQVQNDYFTDIIAPTVPPEDLEQVRRDFLNDFPRVSRQRGRETAVSPKATDIVNISRALGVSPKEVDVETGGKFLDRLDYSFSDTDAEVANKFGRKYPEGTMARIAMPNGRTRLIYQETDKDKWKTVEDYGVSAGDIADVGGEATMLGASIAAGMATGGASTVIQMLAYGGGYAGGYLVKEAVEALRGTQLQTGKEVGIEALKRYGEAGAGVLVAKGISATATAVGRRGVPGEEVSQLLTDVRKAKEGGAPIEGLMVPQQAPESMILERFGAQARSMSKKMKQQEMAQQASALKALKAGKVKGQTAYQSGQVITQEAKKIYSAEKNRLINELGRATPRQTQASLANAVDDFLVNSKEEVTKLYNNVDIIAEKEMPIFNLGTAKNQVQAIKNAVAGIGKPVTREIETKPRGGYGFAQPTTKETITQAGPAVQVADTPIGRLKGVIKDVEELANVQTNYDVIKQLRTRTGELIKQFPWDDNINRGSAKRLYGVLTDVLKNPINKTKQYPKAITNATEKAKARFDVMESASIQRIVTTENTGKLAIALSEPNALTPEVMNVLNSRFVKKTDIDRFKTGVLDQIILDEGGAVKALNRYRDQNFDPESWKWLVPKRQEKNIENIAAQIDKLNKSNIGELVKSDPKALNAINDLLFKEGTSKADIDNIVGAFSEKGKWSLRHAAYEDIISKTETKFKGVQTIDKTKLGEQIQQYKKSGVWDRVLTKQDRTNIQGLKSYMDLIYWRGADPGTSLEAAQAITDLKHPATFFNGLHKVGANTLMAKILMSKAGSKLLIGSPKAKIRKEPIIVLEAIVKGLSEGTEPGSGVLAREQILTP